MSTRRSAADAIYVLLLLAALTGAAAAQAGGDGETFSPPRCATLRYGTVNLRVGPGFQYPIDWVLQRRGLPVEVTARYGPWRRVRLVDRTTGWVYERELADAQGAVAVGSIRTLRDTPAASGRPVARLEPGVVVDLLSCRDGWCSVDVRGLCGWIERRSLWGICQ